MHYSCGSKMWYVHQTERWMIFLIILLRLLLSKPKLSIIIITESEEESEIPRAHIDKFTKWIHCVF